MAYQYLNNVDQKISFNATGETLEQMFMAAAEATMRVMVKDLHIPVQGTCEKVFIKEASLKNLLFELLQELIYFIDADQLLLHLTTVHISKDDQMYTLLGEACGEKLDPKKTDLKIITAVLLNELQIFQKPHGWQARVVLASSSKGDSLWINKP